MTHPNSKNVLITGASGGIGKSMAQQFAAQGFAVTAVARNQGQLQALMAELGPGHRFLVADLSTEAGQNTVIQEMERTRYDLLINNAGVGSIGAFASVSIERQLAMLHLNVTGLVRLSHAYLGRARAGDALINVSSALAFMPTPTMALYAATKAFVTSFSDSLWYEQKSKGVYVMGLCPGITTTQFQTNAGGRMEDVPKGMGQTPEHVARVAYREYVRRKRPVVLTGVRNSVFASFSRVFSRKRLVSMAGLVMSRNAPPSGASPS